MTRVMHRLAIFNIVVIAWLVASDFATGWMRSYVWSDSSRVTWLILALFVAMLYCAFQKARKLDEKPYIGFLFDSAEWMVFLGMIGTFVGIKTSLSGVTLENIKDISGIQQVAVKLMAGLQTEIAATLVGSIFGLWTAMNYTILKSSAEALDRA